MDPFLNTCYENFRFDFWEQNKTVRRHKYYTRKYQKPKSFFNEPIHYKLNSSGYRTYNSIPDQYVLVAGCSHSFGTGLHEHERYSNLLEKELNLPVVNIGVPGTSLSFILFNLLRLITSEFPKPKLFICQNPSVERLTLIRPIGLRKIQPDMNAIRELYRDESILHTSLFCHEMILSLCEKEQIKIINFSYWNKNKIGDVDIDITPIDVARDFDHMGPNTQKLVRDEILKLL